MFVDQFSSLICLVDVVVVVVVVVVNVLDEQYHKGGRRKTGDLRQGNQTPWRQDLRSNLKAPQRTGTPRDGIEKKSSLN